MNTEPLFILIRMANLNIQIFMNHLISEMSSHIHLYKYDVGVGRILNPFIMFISMLE